jgi:hypothetical protein
LELQFARGGNEDVLEKSLGDEFQRLLMLRTCAMGGLYNFVRHCGDMLDEEVFRLTWSLCLATMIFCF